MSYGMVNPDRVRQYRSEICQAMGVNFSESEDMITSAFLGRFTAQERAFLHSRGLVNRGFCPLCGREPISEDYSRGMVGNSFRQFLCKQCHDETNPHINVPGFTRRQYTAKAIMWAVVALVAFIFILGIRACFGLVF